MKLRLTSENGTVVVLRNIVSKLSLRDFPVGPAVKTVLPMKGVWV